MKRSIIPAIIVLVASQAICLAQYSFSTDFSQSQNFTQGVGTTGWLGAYSGNNSSSTFESSSGQLTINDTGGHWEYGNTSGHLLYVSIAGDFTMEGLLNSLSTSAYATAGIGAFDPTVTTANPTATWIGAYYKGFDGEIGSRSAANGSSTDNSPYNLGQNETDIYFKMTRVGDAFTQYYSLNGTDFTEIDSVTMDSLPETLDVGIWDGSYSGNTSTSVWKSFSVTAIPVPEPGTFALAGMGLAGLLAFRRKK